jgi:hypothetical protein
LIWITLFNIEALTPSIIPGDFFGMVSAPYAALVIESRLCLPGFADFSARRPMPGKCLTLFRAAQRYDFRGGGDGLHVFHLSDSSLQSVCPQVRISGSHFKIRWD